MDCVKIRISVMRDSRVVTHGSAALQDVMTGYIPPSTYRCLWYPTTCMAATSVSSTKLRARKSCLAQIKLPYALCMALQTCHPGGTCTAGHSVLSPPVCPIVRKADIHALRLANGHQMSPIVYKNSMYCLGGRISVSVPMSISHSLAQHD